MSIPRVYAAINAVAVELSKEGLAKAHINLEDQYAYRGIDDVYNRLGPVLARHKLCVLPRVLERSSVDRPGNIGDILLHVTVKAAFDFVSVEDGSSHSVEAFGEALDASDKGTAKAMQSAFKYALLQAFCIPLGAEDADAFSPKLKPPIRTSEPDQGWEQWCADILDLIKGCESKEAIGRVQDRYRPMLVALSRERAELYSRIGEEVGAQRESLARNAPNGRGAASLARDARNGAVATKPKATAAGSESARQALMMSPSAEEPAGTATQEASKPGRRGSFVAKSAIRRRGKAAAPKPEMADG